MWPFVPLKMGGFAGLSSWLPFKTIQQAPTPKQDEPTLELRKSDSPIRMATKEGPVWMSHSSGKKKVPPT